MPNWIYPNSAFEDPLPFTNDDYKKTRTVRSKQNRQNCKLMFYPDGSIHCTVANYDLFGGDLYEELVDDLVKRGEYQLDDPRLNNLMKARRHIYDLAYLNLDSWKYMVTLTLDGSKIDRYNSKQVIGPFKKWLQNMVSRRHIKYLIVPELHKDGAIHFHGLISEGLNLVDSGTVKIPGRKQPIRKATAESFGINLSAAEVRTVFNSPDYKLGYSTFIELDKNIEAVSRYMTKYCLKDFQKIFGKTFFAGGHIVREVPTKLLYVPYNRFPSDNEYSLPEVLGQNGKVKYFKADKDVVFELLKGIDNFYD